MVLKAPIAVRYVLFCVLILRSVIVNGQLFGGDDYDDDDEDYGMFGGDMDIMDDDDTAPMPVRVRSRPSHRTYHTTYHQPPHYNPRYHESWDQSGFNAFDNYEPYGHESLGHEQWSSSPRPRRHPRHMSRTLPRWEDDSHYGASSYELPTRSRFSDDYEDRPSRGGSRGIGGRDFDNSNFFGHDNDELMDSMMDSDSSFSDTNTKPQFAPKPIPAPTVPDPMTGYRQFYQRLYPEGYNLLQGHHQQAGRRSDKATRKSDTTRHPEVASSKPSKSKLMDTLENTLDKVRKYRTILQRSDDDVIHADGQYIQGMDK